LSALLVLALGVETRGRTLEEICREEEETIAVPLTLRPHA
jgi:hypothetical protein